MKSQIFKFHLPINILFHLLDKICEKNEDFYFVDHACYKKMLFHKYHEEFLDIISEFYHESKQFYVKREFTYNSFINIIRQICKHNKIAYTSNIKYNESNYFINYYIYHNS
jgi:hypothetical protein